ncbi:helix-turn-helix domain containing protein [Mycobacterium sp. Aquia_216]|uniref:TetR/AcrR family transcriptional regulator n=1 Tax=Mycobacterium sp. Aquia_216 TaxID=2991729 RepID=UPI00227A3131|nr:TetR/AcrR family transcriptional regulator [Mycobacterium sp. Aquia_216]WAJ43455.1 helix-turn-helix domain containing protein [Mycobacterium sp. Aquia_216]
MLAAAEELFATKGYGGATTKEIARMAQTTEAAIFRAFNSKQELFTAAVLAPFENFMTRYAGEWLPEPTRDTPQEALREFAYDLYHLVSEHRKIFTAIMTNGLVGSEVQPVFARLEQVSNVIKEQYGLEWDTPIAARAMVAMVATMAIFENVVYPPGEVPDRERIVDELTRILIGAAGLLPAAPASAKESGSTARRVRRKA